MSAPQKHRQNLKLIQPPHWAADAPEDDWIEDYLDHLCAPLVGLVPLAQRRSLRAEVRSHLESLAEEYGFQGMTPAEAAAAALRDSGEPWQVGQTFLREWLQGSPGTSAARLFRRAAVRALGFFGVAAVLNWLLIEHQALDLSPGALTPWILLLAFFAPLIAGTLTGLTAAPQTGRGLLWCLSALTAHALLTGALLLPHGDGFWFALCLAFWWLPSGWLSATATAYLIRTHHRQRFLKYVR